jgi:hypothetical protein
LLAPFLAFFASLLSYGTATLTVFALISAISSSLGMPVLPGILSREIICGLPRIGKKLFVCRRERWHPNRVGIREAHSQLAPACEHHTGPWKAYRVISLLRSNRIALGVKRTSTPVRHATGLMTTRPK